MERRKEKRQAPSHKGVPAVRPNAPVSSDEPYHAPASGENSGKIYETDPANPGSKME